MTGAPTTPPRALSVAGSDSGGGAGVQADLKTFLALGVHGMSVITAVTAQNSLGVQGVWELPAAAVRGQLASVLGDIGTDAVKTGMLSSAGLVEAVCDGLADVRAPLVVDPVCVSKHGDPLLDPAAVEVLRDRLLPLATVVTPNAPEATRLTGRPVHATADLLPAAETLLASGPRWVLVKGGHLPGPAVDLLTDGRQRIWLRARRAATRHTHGTGCTLAAALAGYLALGHPVPDAAQAAKRFVTGAVRGGFPLGGGIGPVDHRWRTRPNRGRGSTDPADLPRLQT